MSASEAPSLAAANDYLINNPTNITAMLNLEVNYAGIKLRNPFIVSSSGLTNTLDKCLEMEQAGAGAVVLKSLFEEQIDLLTSQALRNNDYPEANEYLTGYIEAERLNDYLSLVSSCSKALTIPVIASINCRKAGKWVAYAKSIEEAGAAAIELNISILHTEKSAQDSVVEHVEIVRQVVKQLTIPVIVKVGEHHDNLVHLTEALKGAGAKAVVLFNRFYPVDINIDSMQFAAGSVFSHPNDLSNVLRWVGIVSGKTTNVDIAASTGVHEWEDAVKVILSGATGVQLCSAIYNHGAPVISQMIICLEEWMKRQGFHKIADFRGRLSYREIVDPTFYERTQFLKYFTNREA